MNTSTNNSSAPDARSLSYFVRAADRLIRAEQHEVLRSEGLRRGDVRTLRHVAEGAPTGHRGPRGGHRGHRLHRFVRAGWISISDEGISLTDEGAALLERVDTNLAAIETRISAALTPELATAAHEALAAVVDALGGEDRLSAMRAERRAFRHGMAIGRHQARLFGGHRGIRGGEGHGHGHHGRGFGHDRGFERGAGYGPGFDRGAARECGHHGNRPAYGDQAMNHGHHRGQRPDSFPMHTDEHPHAGGPNLHDPRHRRS